MKQMKLGGALALVAALVVPATPLTAQEWAGLARVQGRITDEAENPIEGAKITVRFQGQEGAGPDPVFTRENGRWSVGGLADGNWTIIIEKEGMISSEGTVRLTQFRRHPDVIIQMRPIPENKAQVALDLLGEGDELFANQDYVAARERYEMALEKLEPENHDLAYDRIARTHAGQGNLDLAIASVDRALATKPDDPNMLRLKAQLLDEAGRTDESITMLERLHQLDPNDATTIQVLIDLLARSDRDEEAQAYMAKLPEGEKISPDVLLNMGIDSYNEGSYDEALESFNQAAADNPGMAEVYWYRGLVYLARQENEAATADLEKFIELAPDHASAGEAKDFLEYLKSN